MFSRRYPETTWARGWALQGRGELRLGAGRLRLPGAYPKETLNGSSVRRARSSLATAWNTGTTTRPARKAFPTVGAVQETPFRLAAREHLELCVYIDRSTIAVFRQPQLCLTPHGYPTTRTAPASSWSHSAAYNYHIDSPASVEQAIWEHAVPDGLAPS